MAESRELILVVDDDPKIAELLRAYLVGAGFAVETAADGPSAVRRIVDLRPQLVVLDLMLPGLDGFEVIRAARAQVDVPVLMLTARGALRDRIHGLTSGADDYLAKPFAPSEVVARVQAILRRAPRTAPTTAARLSHGDLAIDLDRFEVTRDGEAVDLSAVEFRLLAALVEADGRVLSRDRLLDVLGGSDSDGVMERSVDVYIGRLRAKLGDDPEQPRYVATVRGVGYRAAPARNGS
ncbi:MAG: response regulator transcription factor [Candidatus Dormibacteraeota bacterium]|nr:response regulator transcription factor [Candidatus Dormibacteraeota bacterium]